MNFKKITDNVLQYLIYGLIVAIPIFYLSVTYEKIEFNKQLILLIGSLLLFVFWIVKRLFLEKEVAIKLSNIDISVLLLGAAGGISWFYSIDRFASIFGFYGRAGIVANGLISLLCMIMFYFFLTNNIKIRENDDGLISVSTIVKYLTWVLLAAQVLTLAYIFDLPGILHLPALNNILFVPLANSWEMVSMISGVAALFGVAVFLEAIKQSKIDIFAIFNIVLSVISLAVMVMVNFGPAWWVLAISGIFFVAYALARKTFKFNINFLLLPVALVLIAVVALSPLNAKIIQPLKPQRVAAFQSVERFLDLNTSSQIALGGVKQSLPSAIFGSGIGNFNYNFSKFRPKEYNKNGFWLASIYRAESYLLESVSTMGLFGFLVCILLFYFILAGIWKNTFFGGRREYTGSFEMVFSVCVFALLIVQIIYFQNIVLSFIFWTFLACLKPLISKPFMDKEFTAKESPEMNLAFGTISLVIICFMAAAVFSYVNYWQADIAFAKAINQSTQRSQVIAGLEKASELAPGNMQYALILLDQYKSEFFEMLNSGQTAQAQEAMSKKLEKINTLLDKLIYAWKNHGVVWQAKGAFLAQLAPISSNVAPEAIKAFEEAKKYDPVSPVNNVELAKLYLSQNNLEKAEKEITAALELKPDYGDALFQKSLILEKKGDKAQAIATMEAVVKSFVLPRYPNLNSVELDAIFQLGRMYFNNNQDDQALAAFATVVNVAPAHSNSLYSSALIYVKKGDKQKALELFKKVLELNPGNQDVAQKIRELSSAPAPTPAKDTKK